MISPEDTESSDLPFSSLSSWKARGMGLFAYQVTILEDMGLFGIKIQ